MKDARESMMAAPGEGAVLPIRQRPKRATANKRKKAMKLTKDQNNQWTAEMVDEESA
jgi:hypothetical protein